MAAPPVINLSSSPSSTQLPSSHRLPTISASQALQDLQSNGPSFISTGIRPLDSILSGASTAASGGFERGKVTELWGPSGAGKTAVALQASQKAIQNGHTVTWIDAATPLGGPRVESVLISEAPKMSPGTSSDALACLYHMSVPTLSHLLAVLLHPPPKLFPQTTSLLVVDDLNTLIDLDYPRNEFHSSTRTEQQKWRSGRRYTVLGSLVSALNKLAVLNNLAVIVTTSCLSRSRPDSGLGLALMPGVGGAEWDSGIWSRLVVFRDFGGRFIGVQKCQSKSLISREEVGEVGRLVSFDIAADGTLRERPGARTAHNAEHQRGKPRQSPVKSRKRHHDEIADSDGEDVDEYGWAETDEGVFAAGSLVDERLVAGIEEGEGS